MRMLIPPHQLYKTGVGQLQYINSCHHKKALALSIIMAYLEIWVSQGLENRCLLKAALLQY